MDLQDIKLSLYLAGASSCILIPLGILCAWLMMHSRYCLRIIIDTITSISLVLPPTVIGFYLITIMGPRQKFGMLWEDVTGTRLLFTFHGLLLSQVIINLPYVLRPLVAALESVDQTLLDAASTLGSNKLSTYLRVSLPISWRGLLSGIIFSFSHAIGEFGVVLMIGGNLPGKTRTISISLFDQVQSFDFASAHKTAFLLLSVSFICTIFTAWLRSRDNIWG